ncbi:hypothetical protein Hosp_051 [Mycobacterium phage Hosp]|uniref:hypothetical protein n=1 Tax=Mycobacterium phage 39HC TaxID=1463809 RepID=UPI0003F1D5D4|nr:hypothetical protein CG91_gp052 [Mycobacterium phage 39HC]YP_009032277.1 hypothetical protein FH38_gp51 [Mycobacterium phage Hosp]AHJ88352.1 hypothetical protein 39HC_052 [Mycobacterium phage 39HC]AHJ88452.1 hypothetical protein 40BC_052 [Mycobacterium phage 40BC]AHK12005.1 hypothetical protein Hosp_051 [Mycobacterium phage Hosp]
MPADPPVYPTVAGFCPMGCGATLTLTPDGAVTCSDAECPDPRAVKSILANPHTDHLVRLDRNTVNVQHPLRERVGGAMFDCPTAAAIIEAGRSALEDGIYLVIVTDPKAHPNDWTWERIA